MTGRKDSYWWRQNVHISKLTDKQLGGAGFGRYSIDKLRSGKRSDGWMVWARVCLPWEDGNDKVSIPGTHIRGTHAGPPIAALNGVLRRCYGVRHASTHRNAQTHAIHVCSTGQHPIPPQVWCHVLGTNQDQADNAACWRVLFQLAGTMIGVLDGFNIPNPTAFLNPYGSEVSSLASAVRKKGGVRN